MNAYIHVYVKVKCISLTSTTETNLDTSGIKQIL